MPAANWRRLVGIRDFHFFGPSLNLLMSHSMHVFTLLFHFDNAAQSFFSLHLFLSNFACSVLCWNAHNLIRNLIRDLLSTLSPHSLHQLSIPVFLHPRSCWPLPRHMTAQQRLSPAPQLRRIGLSEDYLLANAIPLETVAINVGAVVPRGHWPEALYIITHGRHRD